MSILKQQPLLTTIIEIEDGKFIEVDYFTEEELFDWFDSADFLPKEEFIDVLNTLNKECEDVENYEVCAIIKKYKKENGL